MTDRVDTLTDRMDKFEVTLEVLNHAWNERLNKLWETQTIIMEPQNQSWQAIGTVVQTIGTLTQTVGNLSETVESLTETVGNLSETVGNLTQKVDKLTDTVDTIVKGLLRPNGKE